MNTVDSKSIPYELGNRHYRRKLATLVRRGTIDLPQPSVQSLSQKQENVVMAPTAFVDETPSNGYVDARTEEERANEPEAVVTTSEATVEPMVIDLSGEDLPATEEVKEAQKLMDMIVAPHSTVSRDVTEEDIPYVIEQAQHLVDLCFMSNGLYATAYAMAHPQIEKEKPLRFFALASGIVVCNPVITRHTNYPVDSEEGCMTAPHVEKKMVQRYHKIEVDFLTIDENKKFTELHHAELQGPQAKVWQHEISHLNGHYCFDADFSPEHALPITK